MSGFSKQVRAARLSFPDIEWLSAGVVTEGMLKKHSDGTRLLTAENYALVKAIIDRHKEASNGIRLLVIQKRTAKAGVA